MPMNNPELLKEMRGYIRFFIGSIFLSGIIGFAVSFFAFQSLIGSNFDTVNDRIDDSKDSIRELSAEIRTVAPSVQTQAEIVDRMEQKIDQLDEDILFIREFVSEVRGLEKQLGYGPALAQAQIDRLSVGGPGPMPVSGWPSYTLHDVPPDTKEDEKDLIIADLKGLYRSLLISDRRYDFSDEKHEIIVFELFSQELGSNVPKLELVAMAFTKQD